jgi:hypothetical protein
MKIKIKKKTKLMVMRNLINKNFCFLIVSGKQKLLSELFGKNSVLHISFFKHLINVDFLGRYAFSYVCIFKFKNFLKIFEFVYDRRLVVHQICVNNSFINFYNLIDYDKFHFLKKILILNIILINVYFIVCIIIHLLLVLMDTLYFLLQKQC